MLTLMQCVYENITQVYSIAHYIIGRKNTKIQYLSLIMVKMYVDLLIKSVLMIKESSPFGRYLPTSGVLHKKINMAHVSTV